jgi:hypothetical protein
MVDGGRGVGNVGHVNVVVGGILLVRGEGGVVLKRGRTEARVGGRGWRVSAVRVLLLMVLVVVGGVA